MDEQKQNFFQKNWLWVITVLVIIWSLIIIFVCNKDEASQIGSWLSGFSATLAFLWIIAGFYQQSKELMLQRNELSLQRQSLELQANELKDLNKYQSLDHISNILDAALKKINYDVNKLFSPLMNQMGNIGVISKTDNIDEAWVAAHEILGDYNLALGFLQSYSTALKLYMDSKNISFNENDGERPYIFLLCYIDHAKGTPYLGDYYVQVKKACETLATFDRVYTITMLIFMIKSQTLFSPDVLEPGALEKLYSDYLNELKGNKDAMPPIIRNYFQDIDT